jgi:hypothetical protein
MDPFRVGILIVAISGAAMMLSVTLPLIVQTVFDLVPGVLVLVYIYWTLKAMIAKLFS